MRIQLLSLFVATLGFYAHGATIENFVIVNSSSLQISGGQFTSGGGGTYSGTFQVDTSQIPPGGTRADFPLTTWDITVTAPPELGFSLEFDPSNGNGSFIAQTEQNFTNLGFPNYGFAQVDSVLFQRIVGQDVFQLTLSMLEPVGTFRGGVVLEASDTETSFGSPPSQESLSDLFGTGMVLDPALLAPEPGTWGLIGVVAVTLCAARKRLSRVL